MYAIIAAGGVPQPGEPLFELTQGKNKALLEISGKPIIQWELDALSGSKRIKQVIVVGLPLDTQLKCSHPLNIIDNQGGMIENVRSGSDALLDIDPSAPYTLLLSADVPAITSEMIDWLIDAVEGQPYDAFYTVVERSVMEKRYPNSSRSYSRLKDMHLCGGDVHAIAPSLASQDNPLWDRILDARKNARKQAALVGVDILFNLLTHRMTLTEAEKKLSHRLGIKARALVCPYAEMGMDVDKTFQFDIVTRDLAGQ